MRQVFSSPRMENVERVAALLNQAGIATRTTHPRSYKGGLRGDFSYRDNVRTDPVPAVWVIKSEDQPAAREILRNAGLLDSTRVATRYTLPMFHTETSAAADAPARKRAMRLKLGLLLVIAIVLVLALVARFGGRHATALAPAPRVTLPAGVAATPSALARAVLSGELPVRAGQVACLEVDGADPQPALLAALPTTPARVLPASRCHGGAAWQMLSIHDYRPGKPSGTIVFDRRRGDRILVSHTYDVRPDGNGWRVVEPYR